MLSHPSLCEFTVAVCCTLLNLGLNQWKNYTCSKDELGDLIKISCLNKRKQKHFSYKQLLQLNFTCSKFKFVGTGQLYGVRLSYQARPWEKTTPARLENENLTHKWGQKMREDLRHSKSVNGNVFLVNCFSKNSYCIKNSIEF